MLKEEINFDKMSSDLERVAIDCGTSFLRGGGTSLFNDSDVTIGRVPDPFLPDGCKDYKEAKQLALQLSKDITTDVINNVGTFAASYLGEKTAELLMPPNPSDIIAMASQRLSYYLKPVGEITEDLSNNAEDVAEKAETKNVNDTLSKLQNDINNGISYINDKIHDWTHNKVVQKITAVTSYISQGPKWVKAQAKNVNDICCAEIEKQIAEQSQKLMDKKQKSINNMVDGYAKRQAQKINEKGYDAVAQKLKKIEQKKTKARNLAASAAKAAVMQLKAILGQ